MSAVTVGCGPHTGHSGSFLMCSSRKLMASASNINSRPMRGSPMPTRSFTVSLAWMSPTMPGRMPSTPPSAHVGTAPGGGGSG